MSVGRMGTGPPLSVSSDPRLFFSLLGTAIAGAFLGFAWITAAGVQTNYYSPGPALWSILLLFVAIGGVMLGAGVATGLGARYGNERDGIPWNPGTAGQGSPWWLGRAAVFTEITGIGLLLMGLGMPLANLGINHSGFPTVLSPTVLWVPEVVDGAALVLLSTGGVLLALGRNRRPAEFRAWWHRSGRYVTVAGVAVLLLVAALVAIPVPQSSAIQLDLQAGSAGAIATEYFPNGLLIHGSWSTNPTAPVQLTIQGGDGTNLSFNASSGTFSLVSAGVPWGVYSIFATGNLSVRVTVSQSFNAPWWTWPPGEPGNPT
ncbi:MAG: hypothetical protein ACLPZM_06770 [Thermoplasmata archaeon]